AGVDGGIADFGVGGPIGDKAPLHHDQLALAFAVEADDGLEGLRGYVVALAEDEVGRELAEMEGFGDALLVRASAVSSAHGFSITISQYSRGVSLWLCVQSGFDSSGKLCRFLLLGRVGKITPAL